MLLPLCQEDSYRHEERLGRSANPAQGGEERYYSRLASLVKNGAVTLLQRLKVSPPAMVRQARMASDEQVVSEKPFLATIVQDS